MKINFKYLSAFFIILIIEIFIAVFVHDNFIRPLVGDILVIVLMYTFIKIFINKKTKLLPVYLFLFATIVELLQYINIVEILHLQNNKVLSIIIGSTFDLMDIVCYLFSAVILFVWESKNTI